MLTPPFVILYIQHTMKLCCEYTGFPFSSVTVVLLCLAYLTTTAPATNTNFFVAGFVVQPTTIFSPHDTGAASSSFQDLVCKDRSNEVSLFLRTKNYAKSTALRSSAGNDPNTNESSGKTAMQLITSDPKRSIIFSALMTVCGAALGPFLDSYHSAFGVLQYNEPIRFILWGSETYPALTTAWWVPELFGLAGFLIGWLYILLDEVLLESPNDKRRRPSPPKTLAGISFFTLQYWLSGILVQSKILDRTGILNLMSLLAAGGFLFFDGTFSGFIASLATCFGGPLIEAGLITVTSAGIMSGGYHYTDLGESGFFPLWIVPVYFLGGPANGNLARGFWNLLSETETEENTNLNDARE